MTLIYPSPLGNLYLRARSGDLTRCSWIPLEPDAKPFNQEDADTLTLAVGELDDYFAGKRTAFSIPIKPEGTAFTLRVLSELMRIPYGATATYGDIARAVGSEGGQRAVAQACSRNPLTIIIPCHRCIRSDGSLGGYTAQADIPRRGTSARGQEIKQSLLRHELEFSLSLPK